jgi:hypothetical protein
MTTELKTKRVSKPKVAPKAKTTPKAKKPAVSITPELVTPFYGKPVEHTKGDGKKIPDRLAPLGSDFPKRVEGRFPFAILHEARKAGIAMATTLSEKLGGSRAYVEACILANGDPNKQMI